VGAEHDLSEQAAHQVAQGKHRLDLGVLKEPRIAKIHSRSDCGGGKARMDSNKQSAAMYLAGHGSFTRPRLIELQYRRIQRYREALCDHLGMASSVPTIFVDFRLPTYGMGSVNLIDVPGFRRLYRCVKNGRLDIVFVDLDDTRERLTPDYESAFVLQ